MDDIRKIFWLVFLLTSGFVKASEVAQIPLFLQQNNSPQVMLAMSFDHQLFFEAYSDYTDLDGDGEIDLQYNDSINYLGYFDENTCYQYVGETIFRADKVAGGTPPLNHDCAGSQHWSGNFLNWATMTRMDVIRKVMYGGKRNTDLTGAYDNTVLQRASLPDDSHAFVKVFRASSEEMSKYTPYSSTELSICNYGVVMQVAEASYPNWASKEIRQCNLRVENLDPATTAPVSTSEYDQFNVLISTCRNGFHPEKNCTAYPNDDAPVFKPTGVLQEYTRGLNPIKFGLISGSHSRKVSGGLLRKNIGILDEWSAVTGQFRLTGTDSVSIINTLDRMAIQGYANNSYADCNGNDQDISGFKSSHSRCRNWGNPLSEIYLEALRYLSGESKGVAAFAVDDYLPSETTWQDPLGETADERNANWCVDTSLITLSTGLNSFDIDQLSTASDIKVKDADQPAGIRSLNVNQLTDDVGELEEIDNKQFVIGKTALNINGECSAKTVSNLSEANGICPQAPLTEGGFHIAGLAYGARTENIRPDISGSEGQAKTKLNNYAISLSDNFPSFTIPVGNGSVVFEPRCESAGQECTIVNLSVNSLQYQDGNPVKGSFRVSWEGLRWGGDYDMDGIVNIDFCVGDNCASKLTSDKIRLTLDPQAAYTGSNIRFGINVSGTHQDELFQTVNVPGLCFQQDFPLAGYHCSGAHGLTHVQVPPISRTFTVNTNTSEVQNFNDPLWYAGKYGGFNDENGNNEPDLQSEWDANNDGRPDNFFQITNPAALEQALDSTFADLIARSSTFSIPAFSSGSVRQGTQLYQAIFSSVDWSGSLKALDVSVIPGQTKLQFTERWDGAEGIPAADSRNLFTSSQNKAVKFQHDQLSASQQALLTADQLAYLRGDKLNEASGVFFRKRESLLGDIVNSSPLFAGRENFGYFLLEQNDGVLTYPAYLTGTGDNNKGGRRPVVYVGANDGMLHAFSADETSDCNQEVAPEECAGSELFAYVPKALYPILAALSSPAYVHQFYVDGSPKMGDAYIQFEQGEGVNKRWGTALAGTLGAGGKGIFALDISNPDDFGAEDVLWDLSDADIPELGYTFAEPVITKLNNNDWAVIVGNGYQSADHEAVLLIINLQTGKLIRKITTGATGTAERTNGLSSPLVVDTNNDRIADYVYAGDLQGNMWKFDLSSDQPANWKIANTDTDKNPVPMFTACSDKTGVSCDLSEYPQNRQPITVRPTLGARGPDRIILFGTGQYFAEDDHSKAVGTQSYYGLFDKNTTTAILASGLQQQILDEREQNGTVLRTLSRNAVTNEAAGWYFDFSVAAGERVVSQAVLRDNVLAFVTLIPDDASCSFGGGGAFMAVNPINGSYVINGFDFNGDGKLDKNDRVGNTKGYPAGTRFDGVSGGGSVVNNGDTNSFLYQTADGTFQQTLRSNGQKPGRQAWYQIK